MLTKQLKAWLIFFKELCCYIVIQVAQPKVTKTFSIIASLIVFIVLLYIRIDLLPATFLSVTFFLTFFFRKFDVILLSIFVAGAICFFDEQIIELLLSLTSRNILTYKGIASLVHLQLVSFHIKFIFLFLSFNASFSVWHLSSFLDKLPDTIAITYGKK